MAKKNFMTHKRARQDKERRREEFRTLCLEAERLRDSGQLSREQFQEYLKQALELVGKDYEILHGLLSIAPRSWREGILE